MSFSKLTALFLKGPFIALLGAYAVSLAGCSSNSGTSFSKTANPASVAFWTGLGTSSAKAITKIDFGQVPWQSYNPNTFPVYIENPGQLDATSVTARITSDAANTTVSPYYFLQNFSAKNCVSVKAGNASNCQFSIVFYPNGATANAFGVIPGYLQISYQNGRGATVFSSLPLTGDSMCWPSLTVDESQTITATAGNTPIKSTGLQAASSRTATTAAPVSALGVYLQFNGDLLVNQNIPSCHIGGAPGPNTMPYPQLSTPVFTNVAGTPNSGITPAQLATVFATGNATSLLASTYPVCNLTGSNITRSCYVEVDFNPQFAATYSGNVSNFTASMYLQYSSASSGSNVVYDPSSASFLPAISGNGLNVNPVGFQISGQSGVAAVWNPSNSDGTAGDGTQLIYTVAPLAGNNVAGQSVVVNTNLSSLLNLFTGKSYFWQNATDIRSTTCMTGQNIDAFAGCKIYYHFLPSADPTLPASPAKLTLSPLTVGLSYAFDPSLKVPVPPAISTSTVATANPPANLVASPSPIPIPSVAAFGGSSGLYNFAAVSLTNTGGVPPLANTAGNYFVSSLSSTSNGFSLNQPNSAAGNCGSDLVNSGLCTLDVSYANTNGTTGASTATSLNINYVSGSTTAAWSTNPISVPLLSGTNSTTQIITTTGPNASGVAATANFDYSGAHNGAADYNFSFPTTISGDMGC